ncbi:MAG: PEGA domain-containing protein [Methanomicrobiales archaeon]|nr:PEGA domain-containing protein [Methanomicrobiales archaeon]
MKDSLREVMHMKNSHVLILVLALMMIGVASAEVTLQTGPGTTASVYTTGSIYVDSSPPGATAVLDGGVAYLFTPGTFTAVAPGTHNIIVAKPGYQTTLKDFSVAIGETSNVIVTLERVINPGGISVSSTPKGVGLFVDGISQGKTDQIVGNLAPGSHLVSLSEAGYEPWSQMVSVAAGQVTTLTATLTAEVNPDTGDLQVTSTPTGASVFVNGNYKGFTPVDDSLDINDLAPGTYTVVVKKSGFQDYSAQVSVEAGKLVQMHAQLQTAPVTPTTATAEIVSTPSGAEVYVNSVFLGITPLSFQNVTPGTYTVEIKMQGYTPYSTTGQVVGGQNIQISAALAPAAPPTTVAPVSPLLVVTGLSVAGLAVVLRKQRYL